VFVEEDAEIAECTAANIFMVSGDRVATPPKSQRILGGITREVVVKLARQHGVPLDERPIKLPELLAATEVFLSGTTVEVLPVVQIDGHRIGSGKPGPVTRRLQEIFQASLSQWLSGTRC
jgi:D-alanine transaminase